MGLGNQFINAAVRQVGRDAGRIVSNTIFGNAHAIKVEGYTYNENDVQYKNDATGEFLSREQFIEELKKQGYKIDHTSHNIKSNEWIWLVMGSLGIMIPMFGLIFPLLAVGFAIIAKEYIMSYDYGAKLVNRGVYTSDKRYKSGARLTGTETVVDIVPVPPTDEQWNKKFKKRWAWLIVAVVWFVAGTAFYKYVGAPWMNKDAEETKIKREMQHTFNQEKLDSLQTVLDSIQAAKANK